MNDQMDAEGRLAAIQKLKELMKQLELEQFAPKREAPVAIEAELPDNDELDDEELARILGE